MTDWLSPGKLSQSHAAILGPSKCDACHLPDKDTVDAGCLGCHAPIAASLRRNMGLHGRLPANNRGCANCHVEHRDALSLVQWPQNDPNRLNHAASAGYALSGAHAVLACGSCHRGAMAVRPDLQQQAHFMGLGRECIDCHTDEHRGELGTACADCHSTAAFKPSRFDHTRTKYPLTGAHAEVPCGQCHPQVTSSSTSIRGVPPKQVSFAHYRGIAHARCIQCHDDAHAGKFGIRCMQCHSTQDWQQTHFQREDTRSAFHRNTRFPLRGSHAFTPCSACHPRHGQAMQMRGLAFARCDDCHGDAHAGQTNQDCAACHTETSFTQTTFSEAQHDAAYPLRAAHRSVACNACHTLEPSTPNPKVSGVRLRLGSQTAHCQGCHVDPHGEQFTAYGECTACHTQHSFSEVSFEHGATRFALDGKHTRVACGQCHGPDPNTRQVIYRPLPTACDACHTDVHAGQFAGRSCNSCHTTEAFVPSTFTHAAPGFVPQGGHVRLSCAACHPRHADVVQWTQIPTTCNICHADWHEHAFDGLRPSPNCDTCHQDSTWTEARFERHDATALPLKGVHAQALCEDCHTLGIKVAVSAACSTCHSDAHRGELGMQCQSCHDTDSWRAEMSLEAHRITNFPLRGAHGALACQECHAGTFARDYGGTPATCMGCHAADFSGAASVSVNHVASGFSTNCRDCHDPWAFQHARMDSHETCFSIAAGAHANMACSACHSSVAGTVARGTCNTGTFTCTQCHVHNATASAQQHLDVAGYTFDNARCYACHR